MNNYIVKIKSVSDTLKLANYLLNDKHKNHKLTSGIYEILNSKNNFILENESEENMLETKKKLNRKGGRPSKEKALSFTFNFPIDYFEKINTENMTEILNLVLQDMANYLDVDFYELKRKSFAVQHEQENQHFHLMISTILNGVKNRDMRHKNFLKLAKQSFTQHTDNVLHTFIGKYKPVIESKDTYDKQEILIARKQNVLAIKNLIKDAQYRNDEKEVKFLSGALSDLEKGHTDKFNKKMKKHNARSR
ncbi:MAG: hypothetical protein KAI79_11635 [Bacteroidales bacterium]|nr:hypothetical protein [Bacteroidales bacterium]